MKMEQIRAITFENLKTSLLHPLVLAMYEQTLPLKLDCGASKPRKH